MADDTNGFASGVERIERIQGGIQRFAVQRAETFVEEQGVNSRFVADQIGQRQRQRQTHEEALAAGKRTRVTHGIGLPGINHFQLQRFAGLALQQIATVQTGQLVVGKPDQIIQRQPLGKLAEFISLFRADQRVQIAPVFDLLCDVFNLEHQRLLLLAVFTILLELLANFALTSGVLP